MTGESEPGSPWGEEREMEFLVEARTQACGVCVFDAAALPPDVDAAGAEGARARLTEAGRAWFATTPANGTWPILLRVDEAGEAARSATPLHRGTLAVPSGRLWICGAEFVARDPAVGGQGTPAGGLARHAMGDCVQVPAGTYSLSVYAKDPAQAAAAPRSRRPVSRALKLGGHLAGGIGVASAAWTLYALWPGDTDETWQEVLRRNVPAILAFLVVGWAMLYVGRMLEGFESARELAAAQRQALAQERGGAGASGVRASTDAPAGGGATAPAPAYVLVLSRIEQADAA